MNQENMLWIWKLCHESGNYAMNLEIMQLQTKLEQLIVLEQNVSKDKIDKNVVITG